MTIYGKLQTGGRKADRSTADHRVTIAHRLYPPVDTPRRRTRDCTPARPHTRPHTDVPAHTPHTLLYGEVPHSRPDVRIAACR